jgi:hypothetical protein
MMLRRWQTSKAFRPPLQKSRVRPSLTKTLADLNGHRDTSVDNFEGLS